MNENETRKETPEQMRVRHEKVCKKCFYCDHDGICSYILIEHHRRPCAGADCVKEGVFRKGKRNNKDMQRFMV